MVKTILITGCSSGIGLGLVETFLKHQYLVIAGVRSEEKKKVLEPFLKEYSDRLLPIVLDIINEFSIEEAFKTKGFTSHLDGLINNAAIYLDKGGFLETSVEQISKTIDVNTLGTFRVLKKSLPLLQRATHPKVMNITSLMGSITDNASGGSYGYRISKAGLNMLTRSFAIDFPHITTVAVHPGWVQTKMGGPEAPTPVSESVAEMYQLFEQLTPSHSGRFFDHEGDELPW